MPEPDFDVKRWLASMGLSQYAAAFAENEITRDVLPELGDEDLKQCGVSAIGHRKVLLREIRKLSEATPATSPAPAPAPVAPTQPTAPTTASKPVEIPPAANDDETPASADETDETAVPQEAPALPGPPKSAGRLFIPVPDAIRREAAKVAEAGEKAARHAASSPSSNAPSRPRIGFWTKLLASKFLLVSILVHMLFGAGATYFVVQRITAKRKVTFKGGPPTTNPSTRALEHKVSMAQKQKSGGAPPQAKRIMSAGLAAVSLPEMPSIPAANNVVPGMAAGMGGAGFGTGMGFGNGMGSGMGGGAGMGGGGGGFMLPRTMADRCSPAARAAAMQASGGDPKCEEAVMKALRNLKGRQNADGSWGQSNPAAMTGLALLSFLGHCERPTSVEFGPSVRKAIDYLVKLGGSRNGRLSTSDGQPWVYEHAIATYALGEAYILTKEEAIASVLSSAVAIIISGQSPDGGWVYQFTKATPSDTSVSGWQVQALKAAHLSGLPIEGQDACMKKAMENMLRVQGPKGGFGYKGKEDRWGLTGVGVLCLQIGKESKGGAIREGLKFMLETGQPEVEYKGKGANLYAWYYNTQACFQSGGSHWGKWRRLFQPQILENQSSDGSWPETAGAGAGAFHYTGTGASEDAQVYRTSLCVLMLEVYYRYLATTKSL